MPGNLPLISPYVLLRKVPQELNELNAASATPRCCPATYFGFPDRAASEPEALTVASPAPVSSAKRSWLVQWERTSLLGGVTRVCPVLTVLTGVITSLAGCEAPSTRWISQSLIFPAQRNFEIRENNWFLDGGTFAAETFFLTNPQLLKSRHPSPPSNASSSARLA